MTAVQIEARIAVRIEARIVIVRLQREINLEIQEIREILKIHPRVIRGRGDRYAQKKKNTYTCTFTSVTFRGYFFVFDLAVVFS
jgi:hypothetical protein